METDAQVFVILKRPLPAEPAQAGLALKDQDRETSCPRTWSAEEVHN